MFSNFDAANIGSLVYAFLKKTLKEKDIDIHSHEAMLLPDGNLELKFRSPELIENFNSSFVFKYQDQFYQMPFTVNRVNDTEFSILLNAFELLKLLKIAICRQACLWLNRDKLAYVPNIEGMQWDVDDKTGKVTMQLPPSTNSNDDAVKRREALHKFWNEITKAKSGDNSTKETNKFDGKISRVFTDDRKSVSFILDEFSLQDLHQLLLNQSDPSINPPPNTLKNKNAFILYDQASLSQSDFTLFSDAKPSPNSSIDPSGQFLEDLSFLYPVSLHYDSVDPEESVLDGLKSATRC